MSEVKKLLQSNWVSCQEKPHLLICGHKLQCVRVCKKSAGIMLGYDMWTLATLCFGLQHHLCHSSGNLTLEVSEHALLNSVLSVMLMNPFPLLWLPPFLWDFPAPCTPGLLSFHHHLLTVSFCRLQTCILCGSGNDFAPGSEEISFEDFPLPRHANSEHFSWQLKH